MCVVKAQVYAGGRGKAGFVKLCNSADEVEKAAKFMLSNRMISNQTGPRACPSACCSSRRASTSPKSTT